MLLHLCRYCVVFVALTAFMAGFQVNLSMATATTLHAPSGRGVVIGHIDRCSGLPLSANQRYSGGTVTVLQGQMRWKNGYHMGVPVFPTHVVATEHISAHQTYHFTLTPGHYVLRARFPHANVVPFVQVTVKRGVTTHVDVPNMCM